jgi:YfiH family protein
MSTADVFENVRQNRERFAGAAGIGWDTVVTGRLTHGDAVTAYHATDPDGWPRADAQVRSLSDQMERSFYSDAVVSDVPGMSFFMTFADCVPLMFWDPVRHIVGAAHGGWRGTSLGIARNVVATMAREFDSDPADVRAVIGPSIGPCCYQVGSEVPEQFVTHGTVPVIVQNALGTYLDLWASNRVQLEGAGVPPDQIDSFDLCTSCGVADFFSHRREHGTTGRSGLLIGLPGHD